MFLDAVRAGVHVGLLRQLHASGHVQAAAVDEQQRTALHLVLAGALDERRLAHALPIALFEEMAEFLVETMAGLALVRDASGMTPMHVAVTGGLSWAVALFAAACPESMDVCTADGLTPLHLACKAGRLSCFEALRAAAPPDVFSSMLATPTPANSAGLLLPCPTMPLQLALVEGGNRLSLAFVESLLAAEPRTVLWGVPCACDHCPMWALHAALASLCSPEVVLAVMGASEPKDSNSDRADAGVDRALGNGADIGIDAVGGSLPVVWVCLEWDAFCGGLVYEMGDPLADPTMRLFEALLRSTPPAALGDRAEAAQMVATLVNHYTCPEKALARLVGFVLASHPRLFLAVVEGEGEEEGEGGACGVLRPAPAAAALDPRHQQVWGELLSRMLLRLGEARHSRTQAGIDLLVAPHFRAAVRLLDGLLDLSPVAFAQSIVPSVCANGERSIAAAALVFEYEWSLRLPAMRQLLCRLLKLYPAAAEAADGRGEPLVKLALVNLPGELSADLVGMLVGVSPSCARAELAVECVSQRRQAGGGLLMARMLPLHLALRSSARPATIEALLRAHPEAAGVPDTLGDLPLHVFVGNTRFYTERYLAVGLQLLALRPEACCKPDGEGWLPLALLCERARGDARFVVEFGLALLAAYPAAASCTIPGDCHGGQPLDALMPHCHVFDPDGRLASALVRARVRGSSMPCALAAADARAGGAASAGPQREPLLHSVIKGRAPVAVLEAIAECDPLVAFEEDAEGNLPLHLCARGLEAQGRVGGTTSADACNVDWIDILRAVYRLNPNAAAQPNGQHPPQTPAEIISRWMDDSIL